MAVGRHSWRRQRPALVPAANPTHNHRMNSGEYTYIWQASDWPALALRPGRPRRPAGRGEPRPGPVDGTDGRCRHGAARPGQPGGADRRRAQDQRDRGRAPQRRLGALVHRPPPRGGHRRAGAGGSACRRRGRDGARRHRQPRRAAHARAPVRLARRAVPDRLLAASPASRVGGWRDDANGPMQVVSGPVGRQRVHFEAPPAERLDAETARSSTGPMATPANRRCIKAGLAHLWFVTLHPFDDGNGRIARAIGDLLLARADGSPQRFYSLSAQIQRDAQGLLRHPGTHPEGHARRDRLARVVPGHAAPCRRARAAHARRRAGQGALLAALGRDTDERAASASC